MWYLQFEKDECDQLVLDQLIKMKGNNMSKSYVKSRKEYDGPSEFDEKKILEAMKRVKGKRKPTSVALQEETIKDLKELGEKLGIPYQVLMRMFILEGLRRMKK